ncbi:hypothetical protein Tco_0931448 [Tanacetum coccineum]
MPVGEKQEQSPKEREVNTAVEDSVAPTIKVSTTDEGVTAAKIDELNLAQTLIEIKAAKPKVVIPVATTTTTTRPKARGVVVQEPIPLKRKDQEMPYEDLGKKSSKHSLIESMDNTQAMMEADFELAQKLQTEEQGEITIEERSRLKKETEESSKGIGDELEADKLKKAKSSEEKAKGSRKKMLGKKRAGKEQQLESSKRQRIEDDK